MNITLELVHLYVLIVIALLMLAFLIGMCFESWLRSHQIRSEMIELKSSYFSNGNGIAFPRGLPNLDIDHPRVVDSSPLNIPEIYGEGPREAVTAVQDPTPLEEPSFPHLRPVSSSDLSDLCAAALWLQSNQTQEAIA